MYNESHFNLFHILIIVVISGISLLALCTDYLQAQATSSVPDSQIVSKTPIKHVIIISQGERSFDNYFGTFPGANGIPNNLSIPSDPAVPPSTNFTVSVWFNTNKSLDDKAILVNKGGLGLETKGKNMNYGIWMNSNGSITAGYETISGTDNFISSNGKYDDGKWHHAVVTYSSSCSLILYIDGEKVAATQKCPGTPDTKGFNLIRVGSNMLLSDGFFTGYIDNLRIWNRTLDYSEILDGYYRNLFNTKDQFVYFPSGDGNNSALKPENSSGRLGSIYFNGSNYQDIYAKPSNQMTFLEPYHLGKSRTDKPYRDSQSYRISYNNGLMNGFSLSQQLNNKDGALVLGYHEKKELPYYWTLASEFVLLDNFFAPTIKTGMINELYLYASSSENLKNIPGAVAPTLNSTIFDLLEDKGLSWKIYVQDYHEVLNNSKDKKKQKSIYPINLFSKLFGNSTLHPKVVDLSEYLKDLKDNNFPALAFIIAPDFHETAPKDVSTGQDFVSALVLSLMNSKHWKDSAFIITYRESGGWYDHVTPPQFDGKQTGFRVPTLVISPFAKKGFVDHTLYDSSSITKFIEYNYNLSLVTNLVTNEHNLLNAFNFTNVARGPLNFEEISKQRSIITSDDVFGVNIMYILIALALPFIVAMIWIYKNSIHIKNNSK